MAKSGRVARTAYTGALNKPIVSKPINEERIYRAWAAKQELLLDHYGIDFKEPECWLKLALRLALDHVPGFEVVSEPRRRGAPKKWSVSKAQKLVDAVNAIASKRRRGIEDAIQALKKRCPNEWRGKGLKTRYYESKLCVDGLKQLESKRTKIKDGISVPLSSLAAVYE